MQDVVSVGKMLHGEKANEVEHERAGVGADQAGDTSHHRCPRQGTLANGALGHQRPAQSGGPGHPGGPGAVLHPLLAVLAEVRLVAQLWLRPGNASCGSNSAAFFLDLWKNLPRHIRLKGVRADSGFCLPELLDLWERLKLP